VPDQLNYRLASLGGIAVMKRAYAFVAFGPLDHAGMQREKVESTRRRSNATDSALEGRRSGTICSRKVSSTSASQRQLVWLVAIDS
jgi:hypothetical protein